MRIIPSSFRLRRFVSFLLLLWFVAASVSGVLLFLRPEGGIARWVGWSALGLDKRQWEAMHITFVVAFLLSSLAHVCYNWRPLMTYLRPRIRRGEPPANRPLAPSIELVTAILVTVALGFGTLGQRQPFTGVARLRADIKNGHFVTSSR